MGIDYEVLYDEVLNNKFTSIFRSGYINIKGTTLPERFKDVCEAIYNLEVYDDDIWVCSFPKSGTTWTQEMVWMIMTDLNLLKGAVNIEERFPFLDFSFIFDYNKVQNAVEGFNPEDYLLDSVKYISNLDRPRFIKTHLPWNLLPKQIQNGNKRSKIIYVTRNPKDACVSYYHHCKLIEGYKGEFNEFCNLFLEGKLSFTPYWTNVSDYWTRKDQQNVLFLKYEDLKADIRSSIKAVAKFLGKTLCRPQIDTLMSHLDFSNMKNNRAVNYSIRVEFHKKFKLVDSEGTFIRAGSVNGYKEEMTPELIRKFDEWMKKHLYCEELGYK